MYSIVSTATIYGIASMMVQVEADVSDGLPSFEMVGILSSEVREARERVRAAIKNTGFLLQPKKITINLCPADVRKSGSGFDLPIALSVLCAYGMIPESKLEKTFFVGEIALNGKLRPIKGILPMVLKAKEEGFEKVVLPVENVQEAELVKNVEVIGAESLNHAIMYLQTGEKINSSTESLSFPLEQQMEKSSDVEMDFSQMNGQVVLRRACEVAAAGLHNILMIGPPGSGKTMAAKGIPGILPNLTEKEILELAGIYSVSGRFQERKQQWNSRPFRCPHYSITKTALIGGGRNPQPGEISLAHMGVLFLDELTEYQKTVLEQLRQPLEEKKIHLVRVSGNCIYPADCMLVAAMNPCNCGYYPDRNKCTCSPQTIRRHLEKISRPFLDRIEITVEAPKVKINELLTREKNESSKEIRKRVEIAHEIQKERYQKEKQRYNSRITTGMIEKYCPMDQDARKRILLAYQQMDFSARTYYKMIRVARTIADLEGSTLIKEEHMAEALMYRNISDTLWRNSL